ncbi:MAG: hypothetical protein WAW90_03285 [Minisyncoccia bacterium]
MREERAKRFTTPHNIIFLDNRTAAKSTNIGHIILAGEKGANHTDTGFLKSRGTCVLLNPSLVVPTQIGELFEHCFKQTRERKLGRNQ